MADNKDAHEIWLPVIGRALAPRVLAIIAVQGLNKEEAARRLLAAGFDAKQIGGLLDVNPNFARVAKLRKRKAKAKG